MAISLFVLITIRLTSTSDLSMQGNYDELLIKCWWLRCFAFLYLELNNKLYNKYTPTFFVINGVFKIIHAENPEYLPRKKKKIQVSNRECIFFFMKLNKNYINTMYASSYDFKTKLLPQPPLKQLTRYITRNIFLLLRRFLFLIRLMRYLIKKYSWIDWKDNFVSVMADK